MGNNYIKHFRRKIKNLATRKAAGDIDIATEKYWFEVKKSKGAIKLEQFEKYLNAASDDYINFDR
jgi:hypothetical protein